MGIPENDILAHFEIFIAYTKKGRGKPKERSGDVDSFGKDSRFTLMSPPVSRWFDVDFGNVKLMTYKVALRKTDEGFSVSCPALPGCWSQGLTEEEAIENIQSAIQEYLDAVADRFREENVREVEVLVG